MSLTAFRSYFAGGCALVLALWVSPGENAMTHAAPNSVNFQCHSEGGPRVDRAMFAGLCRAMKQALSEQLAPRQVELGEARGDSITLRVLAANARGFQAQILWTNAAGQAGESDVLGMTVVDRVISGEMRAQFVQGVIDAAGLPFDL